MPLGEERGLISRATLAFETLNNIKLLLHDKTLRTYKKVAVMWREGGREGREGGEVGKGGEGGKGGGREGGKGGREGGIYQKRRKCPKEPKRTYTKTKQLPAQSADKRGKLSFSFASI